MKTKLPPVHPGEILLHDFLEPLGLSQSALAEALDVTPMRASQIVRGQRAITADSAYAFPVPSARAPACGSISKRILTLKLSLTNSKTASPAQSNPVNSDRLTILSPCELVPR